MVEETLPSKYEKLYMSLGEIIKESELRVLSSQPDALLINNVNFFVKSYLISMCTYLESFLQDLAFAYAGEINTRVRAAGLPSNYFLWRMNKEHATKDLSFSNIDLPTSKKNISDAISANPHKTIVLFRYLGINLVVSKIFNDHKTVVETVVSKRNNIVHHNDRAADISFSDLLSYIDIFVAYMYSVYDTVEQKRREVSALVV